jgi:ribosomal protein L21
MYAVIRSGGKQYRVTPGQTRSTGKTRRRGGIEDSAEQRPMVEDGGKVQTGAPLPNASVEATIIQTDRSDKVLVFKKKRKKQYRRKSGHRQDFTAVRIEKISV